MSTRSRREAEQRPLPDDIVEALAELAVALVENNEKPKQEQNDETPSDPGRIHSS
jgi:hypothetical protein